MGNFIKQFFDIKFWKFILVGILNTVVGMGLQFLFFNLCGWNEWISSLIGYILGSILSYFLNKYFTFKTRTRAGNQSLNLHSILQYATDLPTELQFRSSVCSVRQTAGQCSAGVLKSLQEISQ